MIYEATILNQHRAITRDIAKELNEAMLHSLGLCTCRGTKNLDIYIADLASKLLDDEKGRAPKGEWHKCVLDWAIKTACDIFDKVLCSQSQILGNKAPCFKFYLQVPTAKPDRGDARRQKDERMMLEKKVHHIESHEITLAILDFIRKCIDFFKD